MVAVGRLILLLAVLGAIALLLMPWYRPWTILADRTSMALAPAPSPEDPIVEIALNQEKAAAAQARARQITARANAYANAWNQVSNPAPASGSGSSGSAPAPGAPAPAPGLQVSGTCVNNVGNGPAIVENATTGTAYKVDTGATQSIGGGSCFPFPDQASLDARWPSHRTEFLAKGGGRKAAP